MSKKCAEEQKIKGVKRSFSFTARQRFCCCKARRKTNPRGVKQKMSTYPLRARGHALNQAMPSTVVIKNAQSSSIEAKA